MTASLKAPLPFKSMRCQSGGCPASRVEDQTCMSELLVGIPDIPCVVPSHCTPVYDGFSTSYATSLRLCCGPCAFHAVTDPSVDVILLR